MKVISLFDGMSCGRIALERAGFNISQYFASEIDKHAIKVTQRNRPETIQLGDVVGVRIMAEMGFFGHMDMLIGGSPCQGFSFAGKQLAFDDPRSALFFEYVRILRALQRHNPNIKFMLENVKMKKQHLDVITSYMGVQPVFINSALVSAQNRQRYYWCNWKVSQPTDRGIMLKDIIEHGLVDREKSYAIDANYHKGGDLNQYFNKSRRQIVLSPAKVFNTNPSGRGMNGWVYDTDAKSPTVTTNKGEGNKILIIPEATKKGFAEIYPNEGFDATFPTSKTRRGRRMEDKSNALTACAFDYNWWDGVSYRKLTPVECERLQGLPDNWTGGCGVSDSQRYKMLGNGWQVDTVEHIFREMCK